MIKAVIFDMDGVLIDSEPLWYKAETGIYRNLGIRLTKSMYKETIGMRYDRAVRHWFAKYPWEKPTPQMVEQQIIKKVMSVIQKEGKANEGVNELLHFLKRANMHIALASSSPVKIIDLIVTKLKIKKYFDVIHSGEVEKNPKPHPDIFLTTARMLNTKPEECLVIEDSIPGIEAAKRASMICIGLGYFPKQEYMKPDFSIRSLTEFIEPLWKKIQLKIDKENLM